MLKLLVHPDRVLLDQLRRAVAFRRTPHLHQVPPLLGVLVEVSGALLGRAITKRLDGTFDTLDLRALALELLPLFGGDLVLVDLVSDDTTDHRTTHRQEDGGSLVGTGRLGDAEASPTAHEAAADFTSVGTAARRHHPEREDQRQDEGEDHRNGQFVHGCPLFSASVKFLITSNYGVASDAEGVCLCSVSFEAFTHPFRITRNFTKLITKNILQRDTEGLKRSPSRTKNIGKIKKV